MPILSQKDNPPSRFPLRSILESEPWWWIAKVKPRQEKAFAFDLLEREIEYYLPYYAHVVKRADTGKLRKSLLPLFPSYVPFVSKEPPWGLLEQNRIAVILEVTAQEKFMRELNSIFLANEKGLSLSPAPTDCNISFGTEVKITTGPCAGLIGKVIKSRNSSTLLLQVEGLGRACVVVQNECIEVLFCRGGAAN